MYNVELPDGTLVQVPDNVPEDEARRRIRKQFPQFASKERTTGEAFKDVGASVLGGIGSVLQVPGQLTQLVPGLYGVGSGLAKPGGAIADFAKGLKSQGLQVREALRDKAVSEADKEGLLSGFATAITETIKDPALLSTFFAEQLPQLIGPAAAVKVARLATASKVAAAGEGIAGLAAQKAANVTANRAAMGTGAAMQGADVSSDTFNEAMAYLAQNNPEMSEEQRRDIALNAARKAGAIGLAASGLSMALPGAQAIEKRLAGMPGVGRIKSALGESGQEIIEEGGGQIGKNVAMQPIDPTRELLQGVGSAAGLGAIGGGALGGVFGNAALPPELMEGQMAGETARQSAERLQQEINDLQGLKAIQAQQDAEAERTGLGAAMTAKMPQTGETPLRPPARRPSSQEPAFNNLLATTPEEEAGPTGIASAVSTPERGIAAPSSISGRAAFDSMMVPTDRALPAPVPTGYAPALGGISSVLPQRADRPALDRLPDFNHVMAQDKVIDRGIASAVQTAVRKSTASQSSQAQGPVTPILKQPEPTFVSGLDTIVKGGKGSPSQETAQGPASPIIPVVPPAAPEAGVQGIIKGGKGQAAGQQNTAPATPVMPRKPPESGVSGVIQAAAGKPSTVQGPLGQPLLPQVQEAGLASATKGGRGTPTKTTSPSNVNNLNVPEAADAAIQQEQAPETNADVGTAGGTSVPVVGGQGVQSTPAGAGAPEGGGVGVPKPDAGGAAGRKAKQSPALKKSLAATETEPTPEVEDEAVDKQIAQKKKQLQAIMLRIMSGMGLRDVGLKLVDNMDAEGEYANQLITLALNVDSPVRVLRHESIHAMKAMGLFSPQQWETLRKEASTKWIKQFLGEGADSRFEQYQAMFKDQGLSEADANEAMIEEAIADAFGEFDLRGAPSGLMSAILKRMQNMFAAIKTAFGGTETAEQILQKAEKGKLLGYKSVPARVIVSMDEVEQPQASLREKISLENAWKASTADKKKAAAYAEENGIEPYISEGRLDLPTKFSLKLKEKKGYGMSPLLGIPMNKDGTVTVYYHTTKPQVLNINSKKVIPSEGRNRIYLTNESSGARILGNRGNFDQELDGSTVLLHIPESLLQIDQEYPDGRKDFFVPLAQGDFFNRKMQAASIQAERTKAITDVFSYKEHEERIAAAVSEYQSLDQKGKEKRLKQARAVLKKEHNVGTLMTENGKLEKTRMGGLMYEGQPIDSMGLGLAAAQQISDKLSTCPNAAICEGLCLGETSGGNLVYGGAAQEDVDDIAKSAFRAGPRMMQYLKTEALIIHPEDFAVVLQSEIDSLVKWDQKPTVRKKNAETGVSEQVEKDIYQSAVRLNVTSDFRGEMWRGVIENNPNVMFYDYTKVVGNRPIATNHHLTYSSTGFGQMVDGEKVFFETKSGKYNHNWAQIRNLLNSGKNSAMAFSSKSSLPEFLFDEETGVTYKVLDGDDYDARFLDESSPLKQDSPYGVIVGLRNKASTLKEKSATKETGGFFANYDPKTDGDTVTVPTQTQFGAPPYQAPGRSIPIAKASLRAGYDYDAALKTKWKRMDDFTQDYPALMDRINKDAADGKEAAIVLRLIAATGFRVGNPLGESKGEPTFGATSLRPEHITVNGDTVMFDFRGKAGIQQQHVIQDAAIADDLASRLDGRERLFKASDQTLRAYMEKLRGGKGYKIHDFRTRSATAAAQNAIDQLATPENKDQFQEAEKLVIDAAARKIGDLPATARKSYVHPKIFDAWREAAGLPARDAVQEFTGEAAEPEDRVPRSEGGTEDDGTALPQEVKKSIRAPNTKEFKQWFGKSIIVDETGEPKVMYHGTARDITSFRAKQANAIFVTEEPTIAENYAYASADWMAKNEADFFTPEEKAAARRQVIESLQEQNKSLPKSSKDFNKQVIAYLKTGNEDAASDVKDYAREALLDVYVGEVPRGANILPVFVKAENPFDYENPEHLAKIETPFRSNENGSLPRSAIQKGLWSVIESDSVQKAIREAGFDGFYVEEGGIKNLAVYNPEQIKSAIGNQGTFDATNPDIRYSLRGNHTLFHRSSSPDLLEASVGDLFTLKPGPQGAEGKGVYFSEDTPVRPTTAEGTRGGKQTAIVEMDVDGVRGWWTSKGIKSTKFGKPRTWHTDNKDLQVRVIGKYELEGEKVLRVEPMSSWVESPNKASLRATLPAALIQRVEQTTVAREDKGFISRILKAISPGDHTSIRAELLNRYNQLSVIDKMRIKKMGGAAAMADISAESAALLSDLSAGITASALGVHDKVGGAPVYVQSFYVVRNGQILPRRYKTRALAQAAAGPGGEVRSGGHTAVVNFNGDVKGPLAIFAPLAAVNDPMIYQLYQFWAAAKRGKRLTKEGREELLTQADQAHAQFLEKKYPMFEQVQKDFIKYNDKLVDYMVDTGVLSPERGKIYTEHADYLPFYRQIEGLPTAGPKIFAAISGVKPPKALKGSDARLDDFLETIVRNTQSAIQAGVKNVAAQRAVEAAKDVNLAVKMPQGDGMPTTVVVHENGVPTYYACGDVAFVNAMKSLGMSDIPFLSILSMPANLLRAAVTKEPTFMLANMLRDSMSAYVTSGVSMTPVIDTAKNFAMSMAGKSPEYDALRKAGILGGYEFSQGVETSGRKLGEKLKKANVKSTGIKRAGELAASPFTGVWQLLEKGSEASDAATRIEIYKRTLAETGNETEALFKSLEVMNFNRKGRAASVRILTAVVPFLNARMQGLDVLYRAAIQPSMPGQSVTAREKELQHKFLVRGATMAALSCLYWALTHDDDEYKKQEQDTKDNYWLFPSMGIKIPIPFEIGVLFKVIPERIMAVSFGDDSFKDFRDSMTNQIVSTLHFNPIPQAVIPIVENITNHSFFTGRALVSQGMEGIEAGYQVGPNTSSIMADLGKATGISPIKLEAAVQGYTGQMGMYLVSAIDAMYEANSTVERPAKRFEQLPLIKRFAIDPEARGTVTSFYQLKDQVDAAVKTANMLERGDPDVYDKYIEANQNLLASKDYINALASDMKDLAKMKVMIRSSDDSAEVKKDALLEIQQLENDMTDNIKELKREFTP